jgi:hypothetical protein
MNRKYKGLSTCILVSTLLGLSSVSFASIPLCKVNGANPFSSSNNEGCKMSLTSNPNSGPFAELKGKTYTSKNNQSNESKFSYSMTVHYNYKPYTSSGRFGSGVVALKSAVDSIPKGLVSPEQKAQLNKNYNKFINNVINVKTADTLEWGQFGLEVMDKSKVNNQNVGANNTSQSKSTKSKSAAPVLFEQNASFGASNLRGGSASKL